MTLRPLRTRPLLDLINIEIKYVARYILSVALRMSDVSSGLVGVSTLISELWVDLVVKYNLVVKSQQDDSIKSGIVIRNLCCELLVYVSDKTSCNISTTLQNSIARFVSDSWASCNSMNYRIYSHISREVFATFAAKSVALAYMAN